MVSNRTRANSSVGNKLVQLDSRVSQGETKPQSNLDANAVSSTQISTNAVTPDALAGAAVQDVSVARGAIGTENLGIINEINSDSSLTFNVGGPTGYLKVVGDQYPATTSGTAPLSLNSSNQIVLGLDATVADNTVAPLISSQTSATRTALNNIVARFASTKAILDTYTGAYIGQSGHVGSSRYAWDGSAWQLQLTQAQIHDGSVITTGTVAYARLDTAVANASNLNTGTVAYGLLDTAVKNASNLNTGTLPNGQLPGRLQEAAPEISGQDLNSILTAGWYRGYSLGNGPTADWCYIQVYRHDDGYIWQIAYHYFGNNTWMRRRDGGTWQSWNWYQNSTQVASSISDAKNELYNNYDNGRIDWRTTNLINNRGLNAVFGGTYNFSTTQNATTTYNITFPSGRFSGPPATTVSAYTSVPNQSFASYQNRSASGLTITAYRTANTTSVEYSVCAILST